MNGPEPDLAWYRTRWFVFLVGILVGLILSRADIPDGWTTTERIAGSPSLESAGL